MLSTVSANKFGKCLKCGERISSTDEYFVSKSGYCHRDCFAEILQEKGVKN